MKDLDDIDKKILKALQENFKISYKNLGKIVDLAASSVHNRVQNLIDKGVIKKEDTIIDPMKIGYETIALIGLSVDPRKMKEVANQIASYDEVQMVATSTGDHDIIIRIIAKNEKELWRFINQNIKTIDGVRPDFDVSSYIDIFKMSHKINPYIDD
jgi:Lrp/AsnC family transcriptional regulator for asnA, asnC and gidA